MEMIYIILYKEEVSGALWPEKVNTQGPRAVMWHYVHVAELKETAQAPPPYQHILYSNCFTNRENISLLPGSLKAI